MRRTLRFGFVGIAAVGLTLLPATSAWASPHFAGAAPGHATCLFTINLRFSPALTNSGGGTNTRAVGKATGCTASYLGISFKRVEKVIINSRNQAAPFLTNPGLCGRATTPGGSFSVRWKGNFDGAFGGQNFSGTATFSPSVISTGGASLDTSGPTVGLDLLPPAGNAVVGSFNRPPAGSGAISGTLESRYTTSALSALCAGKGIKLLRVSGLLTIS
ncbi:MAG TPA: hypothetical protein VKR22_06460 [Acidimicrobiales bacterium]|nr:hypothetical protein [Acidimicrobiales bacterium]